MFRARSKENRQESEDDEASSTPTPTRPLSLVTVSPTVMMGTVQTNGSFFGGNKTSILKSLSVVLPSSAHSYAGSPPPASRSPLVTMVTLTNTQNVPIIIHSLSHLSFFPQYSSPSPLFSPSLRLSAVDFIPITLKPGTRNTETMNTTTSNIMMNQTLYVLV